MQRRGPEADDRKRRWKFGQNFLVDEGVVREIAEDVDCKPTDWIVEIGPGQGAITRRLLPRCAQVTALEIDPKWVEHLRKHPEWGNLEVIRTDATRVDVEALLRDHAPKPGSGVTPAIPGGEIKPLLVGNLPYNRAAPILFRFLPHAPRFKSINIMVQYEVAKRMCAKPHSRDFGFLSVFIQNHAEAVMLRKIQPDAFRPRPKVLSATVRLMPLIAPKVDHPLFLRFVELAFSQKRKKMSNSLLPFYPKERVNQALAQVDAGEASRAEDLSVDQFVAVFQELGPPPGVMPRKEAKPFLGFADETSDDELSGDAELPGEEDAGTEGDENVGNDGL